MCEYPFPQFSLYFPWLIVYYLQFFFIGVKRLMVDEPGAEKEERDTAFTSLCVAFFCRPVVAGRPPLAVPIKTPGDLAAFQALSAGAPPFKKAALLPMAAPQPNLFATALTSVSPSHLLRKPARVLRAPRPMTSAATAVPKTGATIATASSPGMKLHVYIANIPMPVHVYINHHSDQFANCSDETV